MEKYAVQRYHLVEDAYLAVALPFEFVIVGNPVSQQARRRSRVRQWTQEVRKEAQQRWDIGDSPYDGAVMVTITYFYDRVELDVDNIPKPILDALSGLAYTDDGQVTDILCRKRYMIHNLQIEKRSPTLTDALHRNEKFVHILVEEAQTLEVIY